MPFCLSCRDVIPGCPRRFEAATRDALLALVSSHAAADHGVTEVTPDMAAQVRASIRET
jgi:predicted small metal-binding protein